MRWPHVPLPTSEVCGVTTLDCVRANKFVHEITGVPVASINIPVIGGRTYLCVRGGESEGSAVDPGREPAGASTFTSQIWARVQFPELPGLLSAAGQTAWVRAGRDTDNDTRAAGVRL